MINTIIFDIGNVLVDFAWEHFYRSFNLPEDQYERIINATVKSEVWGELDKGVWTLEQIVNGFVANDPQDEEILREIHKSFKGLVLRRDFAIDWIKSLKQRGFKCLYLSNYNDYSTKYNLEAIDFLPYLDGGVFSHKVHLIKPDLAIYQLLIEKYNLNPQECLFIDDSLRNCEAATSLGIHSIVFKDLQQVKDEIELIVEREKQHG